MVDICNKALGLTDEMMEEKTPLGRSASVDMLGATSDLYRALERLEYGPGSDLAIPFLESASVRLERAEYALQGVRKVNMSNPSPQEYARFVEWARGLDFDALYEHGTRLGLIPGHAQQWQRLAELHIQEGPKAVLDTLLTEIAALRSRITKLVEQLRSEEAGEAHGDARTQVLVLDAAVVEFSTFGRMISFVNEIEPMDERWRKSPAASMHGSTR